MFECKAVIYILIGNPRIVGRLLATRAGKVDSLGCRVGFETKTKQITFLYKQHNNPAIFLMTYGDMHVAQLIMCSQKKPVEVHGWKTFPGRMILSPFHPYFRGISISIGSIEFLHRKIYG